MLLILIITYFIYNSTAKLHFPNLKGSDDGTDFPKSNKDVEYIIGDPLWVLHLNNEEWLDDELKLGTCAEQEDFYNAVEPLDKTDIIQKPAPRAKKDDPENPKRMPQEPASNRTNDELKQDIMKIINKFVLSTSIEPDTYITENKDDNNPSIALYFKGPMSCLAVKQGTNEWHFVIRSMMFPAWFYERHDTFDSPLAIPEEIKNSFYSRLLRFLKVVLYHPI